TTVSHAERGGMTTTLHSLDTAATGLALFDAAGLRPGARVLDVGCGRGATTLTPARPGGGAGLLLGGDARLTMLEDARRRVAAAALRHVGFVHGDAQTQRFAPLRFDVIVIAGGLSVFADADAGVANLSHALLRGGTLALAAPNDHERVRAVVE